MTLPDTPTNFMHSMIPANKGTFIVTPIPGRSLEATLEPIIAWAPDAENPYRMPHPITSHGLRRVLDGAIMHPCGMVSDPSVSTSFSNLDEWLQFVAAGRPNKARVDATAPDPTKREKGLGGSTLVCDLSEIYPMTTRSFKTNSFWMFFPEGNNSPEFVFTIPAGKAIPKETDHVKKITGKEKMRWVSECGCPDYGYDEAMKFFGQGPSVHTKEDSTSSDADEHYFEDPEVGGLI